MKNTFHSIILALLSLLFVPNISFGQLYEVSLDEKIEKSTLIVEGKVVETKCFRSETGDIYTANKIELGSLLKGQFQNRFLTVTTWGGELDGEVQTWTHLLTLEKGGYGLFFLEPTRVESIQDASFPESFDVFAGSQGFLAFKQNEAKAWIASDPFHTYLDLETDLFANIARKTGQKLTIVSESGHAIRNGVRYHFKDVNFNGSAVTFNIYVNSLVGIKKLFKSGLQIGYNPVFFGSNIATNGNLVMQDAGISNSSIYDLSQSNVTSNKVKIELLPIGSLSSLTEINTTEQLLAKGQITIQNILADPTITYDIAEMQSLSKFYEGGLAQVFDTVIVDGDWSPNYLLSPIIDDFFPSIVAAGIKDTITIIGTDFGTTRGSSRIQFINAHKGEDPEDWVSAVDSQYIFWSDTKIRVLVPSVCESGTSGTIGEEFYAGTGRIRIRTGSLPWQIDKSDDTLHVRFCVHNVQSNGVANPPNTDFISEFSNINSLGGYTLYYSKALKSLAGATGAFERALTSWRCATLVNFSVKDSSSISNINKACRIDLIPLPVGTTSTLAKTTLSTPACVVVSSPFNAVGVGMSRFTISFNKNLLWHTTVDMPPALPTDTYDFESRAVHEIGHAHLLKHSNNHEDLMYFTNLNPPYRRLIKPNDLAGGLWVMGNSTDLVDTTSTNCKPAMIPINIGDCGITGLIEVDGKKVEILIYPSVFSEEINIRVDEIQEIILEFQIFNLYGQSVVEGIIGKGNNTIALNKSMPNGLYVLAIRQNGTVVFTSKIVKQ